MADKTPIANSGQTAQDKLVIRLKIYSPFKTYFDSEAYSVSAENDTGPFDVLPKHHNFITLLNACEILVRSPEGDKRIRITRGVMHVRSDKVNVFLDV
jgi:F0F1-type ATP synthase epsilon subunit